MLGATRLEVDGVLVPLTRAQRVLLARLAVSPGRCVSYEHLATAVWGGAPPATARASLHNQVSRLRAACHAGLVTTTPRGYVLQAGTDLSDLARDVAAAEMGLRSGSVTIPDLVAPDLTDDEPYSDLGDDPVAMGARAQAWDLIASACDLEVDAALARGHHAQALARARRLARESPADEGRAARLVRVLAAAGRRGEALTEIARFRRSLRTAQGLEVGPLLVALERELLHVEAGARAGVPAHVGHLVDTIMSALRDGGSGGGMVAVLGEEGAGVTGVLGLLRSRLAYDPVRIARAGVQRSRDVAVAPLLDLLDDLGLDPDPALGPMGSFVPALRGLGDPVVLIVDDADLAGPSTRRALVEGAGLDGVSLVVGVHSQDPLLTDSAATLVRLDDPPEVDEAVLRRRFHSLPNATAHTVVAAALLEQGAPVAFLDVLGATDGLDDAVRRGLVQVVGGKLRLPSAGLRSAALAETPTGVQEELHHAIGRHLADAGSPRRAAPHLLAAAAVEPMVAVRTVRAAADAASAEGAHADGAELLRDALQCAGPLISAHERLALKIAMGDMLRLAGDPSHLPVLLEAVREADVAGDVELLGRAAFALLQLGSLTVSTELVPPVTEVLTVALQRIEKGEQRALVCAAASLAYSMTGHAQECHRLFLEAERMAHADATRRQVLPFAYLAVGDPDEQEARLRYGRELVALGRSGGDAAAEFEGHQLLCSALVVAGDGNGVRESLRVMETLVDRVGDVGRRWSLLYLNAAFAHLEDRLDESDRLAAAAHGLMCPVSESRAVAALYGQVFGVAMIRGRVDELAPVLEGLVSEQPGVPAWTAAWALCLARSDPAHALRLADQALDAVERDFTWLPAHLIGGRAAALAVEAGAEEGEGILSRFEQRLRPYSGSFSWQGTCSYGPVDTTLALLARASGDCAAADAFAAAAHAQSAGLGAPAFARDLVSLGFPSR